MRGRDANRCNPANERMGGARLFTGIAVESSSARAVLPVLVHDPECVERGDTYGKHPPLRVPSAAFVFRFLPKIGQPGHEP